MKTRMTAYHRVRAAMLVTGLVLRSSAILQAADSVASNADRSAFSPTVASLADLPGAAPEGMVWIRGGEFSMGCKVPSEGVCTMATMNAVNDAQPIHRVQVDGFWMDETDVTNAAFEKFAKTTGYITVAERTPTKEELPDTAQEDLVAGSAVFTPPPGPVPLDNYLQWWTYVKGANWRHPEGPQSDLKCKGNCPVVQVAYEDALAYAKWVGKRLPTEAEWEFAARGGLAGKTYVWGNEFKPGGKFMANTYQGQFPVKDTGEDGFVGISPVRSFPPNGYGLYDMAGNVWQWCSDWYRVDAFTELASKNVCRDPAGPSESWDPADPYTPKRVVKGGSFLCSPAYCQSYRPSARRGTPPDTGSSNTGFRCVISGDDAQLSPSAKKATFSHQIESF